MFPYIEHPMIAIGSYELQAFPVLVGIAIFVQFRIVLGRAPRFGISRRTASSLAGWAILLGIVGAHWFEMFFYETEALLANPLLLFELWGSLSSMGGMLGGLGGLFLLMHLNRMPGAERLRFVDCLIFALPFTLAIGRLGCALQHDHLGVSSDHWLAVQFPDGPRFDLGLLEFLYVSGVAMLFVVLDRRRWPDGFYIGLFFTLYGPVRFAMDTLRIGDTRYLGWTPAQYLSILATVAGVGFLLSVLSRTREAAPEEAA